MSYIANTAADRKVMLETVGAASVEALFEAVPASVRFPHLDLAEPLSEMEVLAELEGLADKNAGNMSGRNQIEGGDWGPDA